MPLGVVHVETVVAEREVSLGARSAQLTPETRKRYPARHSRKATLEMSAHRRAELLRPQSRGANYSSRIVINVVRVVEKCPPRGAAPVEWLLYTSLPVDTPEQILCRRRCLSAALAHRRIFQGAQDRLHLRATPARGASWPADRARALDPGRLAAAPAAHEGADRSRSARVVHRLASSARLPPARTRPASPSRPTNSSRCPPRQCTSRRLPTQQRRPRLAHTCQRLA